MAVKFDKVVTLTFKRSELLYDIKNIAYVEGDVMKADDEHQRHQVFDVGEDGNVDRVTRVMDLVFAKCVELCYPYSKVNVDDEEAQDDTFTETEAYVMHMKVPADFSKTTVTLLTKLIHELIVYRVLMDWLAMTKPESVEAWTAKAENLETEIITTLNNRVGKVRRKLTPW